MSQFKTGTRITDNKKKNPSGLRMKLIVGLVFIVLVFMILIGVIIYLSRGKETGTSNQVVTPDNIEDLKSDLSSDDYIPTDSYKINMNTNWVFSDGSSPSLNAYVKNSLENVCPVYLTVSLASDPDKEIYKSPVIPVGGQIKNLKLDKPLPAGVFDAVAVYHLLDENEKEIRSVSMKLTITVDK